MDAAQVRPAGGPRIHAAEKPAGSRPFCSTRVPFCRESGASRPFVMSRRDERRARRLRRHVASATNRRRQRRRNSGGVMLDRQKVEAILRRRFTGTTDQQVAAAANALMGLDKERDEVSDRSRGPGRRRNVVQTVGVIKGEDR